MDYKLEQLLKDSYDKRESMRFDARAHTGGLISYELGPGEFEVAVEGVVLNESFTGCCLIAGELNGLEVGRFVKVKVGDLGPYVSQVRWILAVEPGVFKVGIRYQE